MTDNEGLSDSDDITVSVSESAPDLPENILVEDAQDGSIDRWVISDNSPSGAQVNNVFDVESDSNVIELIGAGRNNAYQTGGTDSVSGWGYVDRPFFSWRMKSDEPFNLFVSITTSDGPRTLLYNQQGIDRPVSYTHLTLPTTPYV